MCIETFLALLLVGYLSDFICSRCKNSHRTGGSNYIKDERSLGTHYSLCLHP